MSYWRNKMIKKSILLVSILSLVECSQNYVKMTHDAIIVYANKTHVQEWCLC